MKATWLNYDKPTLTAALSKYLLFLLELVTGLVGRRCCKIFY